MRLSLSKTAHAPVASMVTAFSKYFTGLCISSRFPLLNEPLGSGAPRGRVPGRNARVEEFIVMLLKPQGRFTHKTMKGHKRGFSGGIVHSTEGNLLKKQGEKMVAQSPESPGLSDSGPRGLLLARYR